MMIFNSFRSYIFNMIKQDGRLCSINKQMAFKYGNIQMMKSKKRLKGFFFLMKK